MADIETLRAQIERLTKENADHISQNDALYEKFTKAEALLSEQDDWKKNATRLALENKQLRLKMDQTAKAKDDMAGRKDRFNTLLKYMSVQGKNVIMKQNNNTRKIVLIVYMCWVCVYCQGLYGNFGYGVICAKSTQA